MRLFFIVLHLIITLLLIGVILLQKHDDSSQATTMKVRGTGNLLSQVTIGLMVAFFMNSLWIAYMAKQARVAHEILLMHQSQAQQETQTQNTTQSSSSSTSSDADLVLEDKPMEA